MNHAQRENESQVLENIARYREQYHTSRAATLQKEREERHANGEVYIGGCWVPRSAVSRIASVLQRRDVVVLVETLVLMVLVVAAARGIWRLFAFLMLP